jgi:hypothetical protein
VVLVERSTVWIKFSKVEQLSVPGDKEGERIIMVGTNATKG